MVWIIKSILALDRRNIINAYKSSRIFNTHPSYIQTYLSASVIYIDGYEGRQRVVFIRRRHIGMERGLL
jgi:hypothetical protein